MGDHGVKPQIPKGNQDDSVNHFISGRGRSPESASRDHPMVAKAIASWALLLEPAKGAIAERGCVVLIPNETKWLYLIILCR